MNREALRQTMQRRIAEARAHFDKNPGVERTWNQWIREEDMVYLLSLIEQDIGANPGPTHRTMKRIIG